MMNMSHSSPISTPDSLLTYLNNLPPLRQPLVNTTLSSYSLLDDLDTAMLFENLTENPYASEKVGEEPLLLHEEPKMVPQEKPAYVDEPGTIQDVEWPFQECRELAENEWQNHQEYTSQLKPAPLQDVKECEDCGKMGPPLHMSLESENMSRDDFEARSCLQYETAASNSLGCDEIGDCDLIENPFGFMKLCEDHLLLPEECYKMSKNPSQDCKGARPNFLADVVVEKNAQLAVNKRQDRQDCTPQLMVKLPLNVTQCENWGEMGSALHARAYGTEANQKQSLVMCRLQFGEETASNYPGRTISSLDPRGPGDSISSAAFSSVSKDLIASVEALSSTSNEMQMVKLSEDSESSNLASVHDDEELQPTSPTNSEESNQLMARQENRKRTMPASATYRCQCKKRECILRYCGCFAAGFYCNRFCNCRGCSNKPECEDKIDYDRHRKKPRNYQLVPAPKPVQNDTVIKPNTPNTFKVGCSSTCLCQGCQNSNGKREGAELHDNDGHRLSVPTPSLQWPRLSQSSLTNVNQLPPLTNHASMFGTLWDWTHIPRENSYISVSSPPMPITPMTISETTKLQCHATDNPSNNTEGSDRKRASSPFWHKQGCACRKSKCLRTSCACYLFKAECSAKCQCRGCENSHDKKKGHVARNKLGAEKGSRSVDIVVKKYKKYNNFYDFE